MPGKSVAIQRSARGWEASAPMHLVDDRAVAARADLEHLGRGAALDLDLLLDHVEVVPLALELVAVALDPLDEDVLDVGHHVGEGPGDVVVLAHRDPGDAGQGRAAAEAVAQLERVLVPDPGHPGRQVGIAGDQGPARGAALRADGPVVRAASGAGHADLLAELRDLARPGWSRRLVGLARLQHDRIAVWVDGVDALCQLGAELADQVGAQQLALPVRREAERQELRPGQQVGGAPRLEVEAEHLELGGERPGARFDGGVEPGAVGVELRADRRVELGLLAERVAAQAQGAHQLVEQQGLLAGHLRDAARGDAAGQVALPQAVLGVDEPLAEPEVVRAARPDPGHAPAVAGDLDAFPRRPRRGPRPRPSAAGA